ncbi:MAG: hypothetical protein KBA61_10205 [Spirochaetes bacterium]|nr:hypothetical protein [Spirochaetota bacterium]
MPERDPFNPTIAEDLQDGLKWAIIIFVLMKVLGFLWEVVKFIARFLYVFLILKPFRRYHPPKPTREQYLEHCRKQLPKNYCIDQWGNVRKKVFTFTDHGTCRVTYLPEGPIAATGDIPNPLAGRCQNVFDER